jgi:hypothetical protein
VVLKCLGFIKTTEDAEPSHEGRNDPYLRHPPGRRCDPVGSGLRITFADGSVAHLDASHPHYEVLRVHAEHSRGRPRPVGVVLEPGNHVADLNTAHDTTVRQVRELPANRDRLEVTFWGYSPVCGLMRDQPEFERIYATLSEAVTTGRTVWVVTHTADVVEDGPDEEGSVAFLPKIMDVRWACCPSSS